MSDWLERRSIWQFAVIWGVCMFLPIFLGGTAIQWLMKGRIDISYLIGYGLVFAVVTGIGATLKQRFRKFVENA
jgi:hypothetical protein